MGNSEVVRQVIERTNGEIYLGVVGAVRTGKSTFIKKFMEALVLPYIEDNEIRNRVVDEIPQSAEGKSIMTTEPKFVPNQTLNIAIDDNLNVNMRLVDCVGFVIPNSKGYEDENGPRMVKTPWFDEAIPFHDAAEIGTKKVIKDHSTIGIVLTTDGSIGDFTRDDYVEAEERVIEELKSYDKPFIVILNSKHPNKEETVNIRQQLVDKYNVPVLNMSVEHLTRADVDKVLQEALYEFKIEQLHVRVPSWINVLREDNQFRQQFYNSIDEYTEQYNKVREVDSLGENLRQLDFIDEVNITEIDPAAGSCTLTVDVNDGAYYDIIEDIIGERVDDRASFLDILQDMSGSSAEFKQYNEAIQMVKTTGYGIASPRVEDMVLDDPEILKQGPRFGVKLKAIAPSIHMIKVNVESTFEPIIGTEQQSKELINYIMKDYERDPLSIWKSEIFGRSLSSIVNDGIRAKLHILPENARYKFKDTLEKVVNESRGGIIAIIL